jgi:predicted amidophosphoribosyltransferase
MDEGGVELILVRPDPVAEGPDTIRCPACGTGVQLVDGICSACGQVYCPGCGHPFTDDEDDEICPACGLALSFACPGCGFAVASGAKLCPECSMLFVRRCPACETRILDGAGRCPECGQPFNLEPRASATIFASAPGLVLLRCPVCTDKFGSELGACPQCGQRACPQCYLLLKPEEVRCPHCSFHAARPCPACKADVGQGLPECPSCGQALCPACGAAVGLDDSLCVE